MFSEQCDEIINYLRNPPCGLEMLNDTAIQEEISITEEVEAQIQINKYDPRYSKLFIRA